MRRKWGPCSSGGTVTLASDIVGQDARVQDVVIVYELLHGRVPNRGRLFNALMSAHVDGRRTTEEQQRHGTSSLREACMNGLVADARHNDATPPGRHRWKQRLSAAGVHLFDRVSGLNVLVNEIPVPPALHSPAPRQVSVALTNRCDLACSHCYAPKSRDELRFETVTRWLSELDEAGTLGVGFGGGEPTLYPDFVRLCQHVARETRLAVSFTTHGHHFDSELAARLRGSVHFIRVSMDAVGKTYEFIRRRSFFELLERLAHVRSVSRFGVNVVVNERTLPELGDVARVAAEMGACELLLLPQIPVRTVRAIDAGSLQGLRRWVDAYTGPLKLCISELSAEGFPTCDPLLKERGLLAYAHIDASGVLKASSYANSGVQLGDGSVLYALDQLTRDLAENET